MVWSIVPVSIDRRLHFLFLTALNFAITKIFACICPQMIFTSFTLDILLLGLQRESRLFPWTVWSGVGFLCIIFYGFFISHPKTFVKILRMMSSEKYFGLHRLPDDLHPPATSRQGIDFACNRIIFRCSLFFDYRYDRKSVLTVLSFCHMFKTRSYDFTGESVVTFLWIDRISYWNLSENHPQWRKFIVTEPVKNDTFLDSKA